MHGRSLCLLLCFCRLVCHLITVCVLKMALNHFIQWHPDMRDCLKQIGPSWRCVHLDAWQMRQRRATWEPCRVKRTWWDVWINHCCQFPPEMHFLCFGVDNYCVSHWHVFQGHCIPHCTVTVCQLIISPPLPSLSVCWMPLLPSYLYNCFPFVSVFSNLFTVDPPISYWSLKRKSQGCFTVHCETFSSANDRARESLLHLLSTPWGKKADISYL